MKKTTQQTDDQNRSNIFNRIAFVALGISLIIIGLFAYWAAAKDDVLTIKNDPVPFRTIRPKAKADGIVFLKIDYCKNVGATGRVMASFVSQSRLVLLPVVVDNQPPQCRNAEVPIPIPHDIAPGKYRLHYRIIYNVNPLKTDIVEEFDSQEFEIEAND